MNAAGVEGGGEGFKGVFKVHGKTHDVFLDRNEIVWIPQGELHTGIH